MTQINLRGLGDRWLAGEPVPGISFTQHQAVEITAGAHSEKRGTVVLLLGVSPEPLYLVALEGAGDVRARQSALRAAS